MAQIKITLFNSEYGDEKSLIFTDPAQVELIVKALILNYMHKHYVYIPAVSHIGGRGFVFVQVVSYIVNITPEGTAFH